MTVKHWIEVRQEKGEDINLIGNTPRMSADTIRKLIELKNKLLGIKRSIYEESLMAEEQEKRWL